MDWFKTLSPILQALLATLFTWGMTALGASLVFLLRSFNQKLLDGMMGFAGGVMIAASFFSLLLPAMDLAGEAKGVPTWFPIVSGFLLGGVFIGAIDKLLPHLHEGLAVGVAFGSLVHELPGATLGGAVALALGIGIQNFPEGTSVSMPLRREGFTRRKSFAYGQASGVVEPIAGVIGASAVLLIEPMLPYALSFAAGAMIYVVVEELIPESQLKGNTDIATIGVMGGFAIMMALDVALGG
jgi:ZIP family zinc transporter